MSIWQDLVTIDAPWRTGQSGNRTSYATIDFGNTVTCESLCAVRDSESKLVTDSTMISASGNDRRFVCESPEWSSQLSNLSMQAVAESRSHGFPILALFTNRKLPVIFQIRPVAWIHII